MFLLVLIVTIGAGMLTPIQGCVNGALGKAAGRWEATLVSMLGGTLLMLVLTLLFGNGDLMAVMQAPVWLLVAATVIGTLMVIAMVICAPKIGISLSTVILLLTSLVFNVFIDQYGWFGLAVKMVDPYRIIGIVLMAVGIVCSYYFALKSESKKAQEATGEKVNKLPYILIMVASGVLTAVYYPLCSMLTKIMGGTLESTFVLFFLSAVLTGAIVLLKGGNNFKQVFKQPKWQLIGGFIGSSTVAWSLVSVVICGSLIYTLATTMGRILMAVIIDFAGWMGMPKIKINALRIIGLVFMLASVIATNAVKIFGL